MENVKNIVVIITSTLKCVVHEMFATTPPLKKVTKHNIDYETNSTTFFEITHLLCPNKP